MDLVTGATGFVGSAVTRYLLAQGRPVRALVRDPARLPADLAAAAAAGRLEVVRCDLLDLKTLAAAAAGCTHGYHCAGAPAGAPAAAQLPAHGAATHNLLLTCRAAEMQRVAVVSALAAARPAAGDAYGAAKAVQEEVAADFRRHRLEVVLVRPAAVFGPGGRSPANAFAAAVARGALTRLPDGAARPVSCTYVQDLAGLLARAVTAGEAGATYTVASETLPLQTLVDRICRLAGRALPGTGSSLLGALARLRRDAAPLPAEWLPGGPVARAGATFADLGFIAADQEAAWAETLRWQRQSVTAGVAP